MLYFLVSIPFTTSTDHGPTFVLSMLMLSSIFVMICDLFEWKRIGVGCFITCDVRYDFRIKTMSFRLYLQLFVAGCMSYLRYLCLLAHSGVQHIFGCAFDFSSCAPCVANFSGLDCAFSNLYCMTFLQFPIKGNYISSWTCMK